MLVYLDQKYFDNPDQGNESHWVRNGLLTTGALVGAHFGAKAGLFGRHAQQFAGNMHTRMGNALGWHQMARSGQNAAAEATAMMKAGITDPTKWASDQARAQAMKDALKSGDVVKMSAANKRAEITANGGTLTRSAGRKTRPTKPPVEPPPYNPGAGGNQENIKNNSNPNPVKPISGGGGQLALPPAQNSQAGGGQRNTINKPINQLPPHNPANDIIINKPINQLPPHNPANDIIINKIDDGVRVKARPRVSNLVTQDVTPLN